MFAVRRFRQAFQHEFPVAMHTVPRLRLVRRVRQNARDHFVQRVLCEGRQDVVPDQLSPGARYLHRVEESGEYPFFARAARTCHTRLNGIGRVAIPQYTGVHHLQEPHHHSHRTCPPTVRCASELKRRHV